MKGIHSAALAAAAITGFAALPSTAAADEGQRWEGCSVGLETSQFSTTVTFPNDQPDQDLETFMVGPSANCRMQFDNGLVLGVNGRALFGEADDYQNDGNYIDQVGTSDSLVALSGLIGFVVGNALLYAEGGKSEISLEQREVCPDPAAVPFGWCRPANGYSPYDLSEEQTEEGTFYGAGINFATSDDWSIGLRYTRHEFEGARYENLGPAANGNNLPAKQVEDHDADEIGINIIYQF